MFWREKHNFRPNLAKKPALLPPTSSLLCIVDSLQGSKRHKARKSQVVREIRQKNEQNSSEKLTSFRQVANQEDEVPVGSDFECTRFHIHTERFTSRKTTRNHYMLPQVGLKKDKIVPLRQKKGQLPKKNRTSQPNFPNLTCFFCTAVFNSFVERSQNLKALKNLNCYQI